jgi:hypothetical protein
VNQFEVAAAHLKVRMGRELQEVVEVCGKPEAFRVVIQFGPGTRAEQGGLVGGTASA